MKSRILPILLVISFVAANLIWLFVFMDKSVTIDYMSQEVAALKKNNAILMGVVENKGVFGTKEVTARELKRLFPDEIVKIDGDTIFVNEIGLSFRDGTFSKVVLMNE